MTFRFTRASEHGRPERTIEIADLAALIGLMEAEKAPLIIDWETVDGAQTVLVNGRFEYPKTGRFQITVYDDNVE